MKSLFLRILVSLWLTMTLIGGIFAAIHALTFPELDSRRRTVVARSMDLRASRALDCALASGADCDAILRPIDPRDQRLAIYRDGTLFLGEAIDGADSIMRAARDEAVLYDTRGDSDLSGTTLRRGKDGDFVVVALQPRPSRWTFFVIPETLPWRLLSIFAVTGLVSVALARYLTRPIRSLRGAAQKLAKGDLDVRVSPELVGADTETLALGEEMDRMAERIQELLASQRRLLRDVSHELRSPLARLNLALELVRRQSPEKAKTALDRIERESERLAEMIGELLTLSRLEAGEPLERPETVDVSELASDIVADVGFEAEQKGAKLDVHIEPGLDVTGNPELLRRAIENVLRNALRFTEPGSEVRLDLARADAALALSVRDHGPGVPESAIEDIWKPFYRVSDDRARKTGGAGIGLAITHGAIIAHGGTVSAKNAEGGGLLVEMKLPRVVASA